MKDRAVSSLEDGRLPPRLQRGGTHITDGGQPSRPPKKEVIPKGNLQFAVRLTQPWIDALAEMYPGYSPGLAIRKYIETHVKPIDL